MTNWKWQLIVPLATLIAESSTPILNSELSIRSRINTGGFFACNFLIKMDLAKLHLLNGGFDHDTWDLLMEIILLS